MYLNCDPVWLNDLKELPGCVFGSEIFIVFGNKLNHFKVEIWNLETFFQQGSLTCFCTRAYRKRFLNFKILLHFKRQPLLCQSFLKYSLYWKVQENQMELCISLRMLLYIQPNYHCHPLAFWNLLMDQDKIVKNSHPLLVFNLTTLDITLFWYHWLCEALIWYQLGQYFLNFQNYFHHFNSFTYIFIVHNRYCHSSRSRYHLPMSRSTIQQFFIFLFFLITKEPFMAKPLGLFMGTQTSGC